MYALVTGSILCLGPQVLEALLPARVAELCACLKDDGLQVITVCSCRRVYHVTAANLRRVLC
jgi:hypothetical protein